MYSCQAAETGMDVKIPQLAKNGRIAPHEILPNDKHRYMREQTQ